MTTALFGIYYQPFKPYKKAEVNLKIARDRGFPIYIAWDDRNSREDYDRLRQYTENIYPFKSGGHCENGYRFMSRIEADFALLISDDEQASPNMWSFAEKPPMIARYAVLIIPILKINGEWRIHRKHLGSQERLTWVDGWHWNTRTMPNGVVTTFEATANSPAPWVVLEDELKCVVWHHLLDAPREEREEKARRYAALDPWGEHTTRLFYEETDFDDEFVEVPDSMRAQLPKE